MNSRSRIEPFPSHRSRNAVERSFAYAKQWRHLATRFIKLAIVSRATDVISAKPSVPTSQ
ncbi:hypothetical protein CIK59_18150 [Brevibacterium aurantiacum]|uniref:Uncharacterized protein n=1 Tax=Brevibacterium aurantiacum TaxID=273384 RepID=A0A2A3ZLA0_BREAU|nr:hypothetical protein CIK59_18150 [Brevibacterium aurantiacum]